MTEPKNKPIVTIRLLTKPKRMNTEETIVAAVEGEEPTVTPAPTEEVAA